MVRSAELLRCSCAQLYEAYLATGGPEAKIVHPAFEQESSGEPTLVNDPSVEGGQKTVDNPKAGQPKTWDELTVPEKEGAQWLGSLKDATVPGSKNKWDAQAGPITMGTPLGPSLRPRLCAAARNLLVRSRQASSQPKT